MRRIAARLVAASLLAVALLGLGACGHDDTGGTDHGIAIEPIKITLSYGNNDRPYMPSTSSVAQQVAIALRDVGFDVTLEKKEWASYLQMVKNGEHQMGLLGWSADYPDADNFLYVLLDKNSAVRGRATNISFYDSEAVHELLVAAQRTDDRAERTRLYHEAQEIIFDDCPMVPLVYTEKVIAYRKAFGPLGVEPMMHPILRRVTEPVDGTITWLRGQDSVSLDPGDVSDGESSKVIEQVFDTLLRFKPGSTEVEASLATAWALSEDRMSWTFQLREGVTFHDGSPLDAEVVVNAFERQRDPEHPYHFKDGAFEFWHSLFKNSIAKVEVGSHPLEVVFRLQFPSPPYFLSQLAQFSASIPSKAAFEKHGKDVRGHPVGTGPFKFVKWENGVAIHLERNDDYWDGAPKLKAVIFRISEDATVRARRLRSDKDADLIDNLEAETLPELEADPEVAIARMPGMNVAYLAMNTTKKPFDDKRVRQAVAFALNKARIIKLSYRGLAKQAATPVPPTLPGHNGDIVDRKRDAKKARELLREAGHGAK